MSTNEQTNERKKEQTNEGRKFTCIHTTKLQIAIGGSITHFTWGTYSTVDPQGMLGEESPHSRLCYSLLHSICSHTQAHIYLLSHWQLKMDECNVRVNSEWVILKLIY